LEEYAVFAQVAIDAVQWLERGASVWICLPHPADLSSSGKAISRFLKKLIEYGTEDNVYKS
jgi:hypothetical protein